MPSQHVVQFCGGDDRALIGKVARFVAEGLDAGESIIAVTSRERRDALFAELDRLRGEPGVNFDEGRITALDREHVLELLESGGHLCANRFERIVGSAVREAAQRSRSRRVRVYGDVVDALWERGRHADAVELEKFWNDLQAQMPFDLFCGYSIDVFGDDFQQDVIAPVLAEHSRVVSGVEPEVRSALDFAAYEALGRTPPQTTDAEEAILWLRSNAPRHTQRILTRARRYSTGTA